MFDGERDPTGGVLSLGTEGVEAGGLKPGAENCCMGFAMLVCSEYAFLLTRQGVVGMLTYYPRIVSFEKLGEN